jgi:hypothetical protein
LAEAAKRLLGDEEGITLMELLPPVGWADVATKQDLVLLRTEIDARFDRVDAQFSSVDARFDRLEGRFDAHKFEMQATMERELRSQTWKLFALHAASMGAVIGALVAVAKF